MKVCALSPSWMTRPSGDVHCGWGFLHMIFQWIRESLGVIMTNLRIASGHPFVSKTRVNASSGSTVVCQDSSPSASSYTKY